MLDHYQEPAVQRQVVLRSVHQDYREQCLNLIPDIRETNELCESNIHRDFK